MPQKKKEQVPSQLVRLVIRQTTTTVVMRQSRQFKLWCLLFLLLTLGPITSAFSETNVVTLRAHTKELRDAVHRCQRRIDNGELDECFVNVSWEYRQVSMSEALEIANELEPQAGTWHPMDSFSQINVACRRTYVCRPSEPIMHGSNTKFVGDVESVWGACSTGGDDPTTCSTCITQEPNYPCTWHLER